MIENYYNSWGMSELGPINLNKLDDKIKLTNLFDMYKEKISRIENFTLLTLSVLFMFSFSLSGSL